MPKTHKFTKNSEGEKITVVLSQIQSFNKDNFSECTRLSLIGGVTIGVSETEEEVRKVLESA